jgi:hypothetical protein
MRRRAALLLLVSCTKAAQPDAGAPVKDAAQELSCIASSLNGYQPAPWVAPRPARKVCTADQIDQYWNVCVQFSALPIQCQQFVANNADCAACLSPDTPDAGPGPLVAHAGVVDVNVGGCIALVLADSSVTGCGAREQAARDCAAFACAGCDGGTCATAARQGVCSDSQMRTCGELGGAAPCTLDEGPLQDYRRIAAVFCSNG